MKILPECSKVGPLLWNLAAGRLAGAERTQAEAHLSVCSSCRRAFEEYRRTVGMVAEFREAVVPPTETSWQELRQAIAAGQGPKVPITQSRRVPSGLAVGAVLAAAGLFFLRPPLRVPHVGAAGTLAAISTPVSPIKVPPKQIPDAEIAKTSTQKRVFEKLQAKRRVAKRFVRSRRLKGEIVKIAPSKQRPRLLEDRKQEESAALETRPIAGKVTLDGAPLIAADRAGTLIVGVVPSAQETGHARNYVMEKIAASGMGAQTAALEGQRERQAW